jgi:hypothetical protein
MQYGSSDVLPNVPQPADCSPEVLQILKYKMWFETCPMAQANGIAGSSDRCHG